MDQKVQAHAKAAILPDIETEADRPLQLLLCAGEFSCGVVILQSGDKVCEEVAGSKESTEKLYMGEVQAIA